MSIQGTARLSDGQTVEIKINFPLAKAEERTDALPERHVILSNEVRHSPDFGVVHWFGKQYHFSPKQRMIVAALWQAWKSGYEWVEHAALLEVAESEGSRVRDLFRTGTDYHPAWGTMIVQALRVGGPPGSYRLSVDQ